VGALATGATEVLAGESHGNMRNILPESFDPRVSFSTGQPKPMNHAGGVDASFDLALFRPYTFQPPVTARITFTDPSYAGTVEHLD